MFQDLSGSESYHSMPWFLQTPSWELPVGQVLDGSPEEVLQASALKAFDKDGLVSTFHQQYWNSRVNSFNSNIGQHVDLAPPSKSYEGRQGDDVCS